MANLRDIPKSKVLNDQGFFSSEWAYFIRDLFTRAGGNTALSNLELEQSIDDSAIGQIAALQTSVASLTIQVTTLRASVDGLGQEPAA